MYPAKNLHPILLNILFRIRFHSVLQLLPKFRLDVLVPPSSGKIIHIDVLDERVFRVVTLLENKIGRV